MAQTYRYNGDSIAVVLIDNVAFQVGPNRLYDGDDLIVITRPDLFALVDGNSDDRSAHLARIDELEDEVAALQAALLDAGVESAEAAPLVEDASAAPGAKRARTAARG